MKTIQLILFFGVLAFKGFSQGDRMVIEILKDKDKSYSIKVLQPPSRLADTSWLPSFEQALKRSISTNRKIKKGKYVVTARFIRDKEGNVSDAECDNDLGFGIGAAVVSAIKKSVKSHSSSGYQVRPYKQ